MSDETTRIRARLVAEFPRVFAPKGAIGKIPLKLGIHRDIVDRLPDLSIHQVRAALRDYTGGPSYLRNHRAGVFRIDLDGNVVGEVTEAEAKSAQRRLAEITNKPRTLGEILMCGSSSVSQSSFVKDPSAPDIDPSLISAAGALDVIEELLRTGQRDIAVAMIAKRDEVNVGHGRNTPSTITHVAKSEIAKKMELILSLMPTKKIEAIKEVRALSGMGLKEAKDWVEGRYSASPAFPMPTPVPVPPPPAPLPPADPYKENGFMVLKRHGGTHDFEIHSTDDRASYAKSIAKDLAGYSSTKDEILVVEVLGRSKLVFEMLAA